MILMVILFRQIHIFILNDNGDKQSDSRTYGLIDKDDIVGDVSLKVLSV